MKNNKHGFTDNNLLFMKPCMLVFIQTLPRVLCAGAISCVSFYNLFGTVTKVNNNTIIISITSAAYYCV